jgi:hypothetical protein
MAGNNLTNLTTRPTTHPPGRTKTLTSGKTARMAQPTKRSKKKLIIAIVAVVLIAGVLGGLTPVFMYGALQAEFKQSINDASDIFANDLNSLVYMTSVRRVLYDHMLANESGKEPKLLFVGYDGSRADLIPLTAGVENSALRRVYSQGAVYLGRTGGATRNGQNPSTAPSWTALFTGEWANVNGVTSNIAKKSPSVNTIMYTFASAGIDTVFAYSWPNYHRNNYTDEFNSRPSLFSFSNSDQGTFEVMLNAINGETSAIFGIFEHTDKAGHKHGFNPKNSSYLHAFNENERLTSLLLDAVFARETYHLEDWLIVIASDHGGYLISHFEDRITTTTVFFAFNKKIDF